MEYGLKDGCQVKGAKGILKVMFFSTWNDKGYLISGSNESYQLKIDTAGLAVIHGTCMYVLFLKLLLNISIHRT